jgi:hypothetical protein
MFRTLRAPRSAVVDLKVTKTRILRHLRVGSSRERQAEADHPQQQHQQQRWSTVEGSPQQQQHHQQLQQVLNLTDRRFKTLAGRAPFLLHFEPQTRQVTVEALAEALHVRTWAVCRIIEQRPGVLLTPWEPVQTLQMLADVLGLSSSHTGEGGICCKTICNVGS